MNPTPTQDSATAPTCGEGASAYAYAHPWRSDRRRDLWSLRRGEPSDCRRHALGGYSRPRYPPRALPSTPPPHFLPI